MRVCHAPFMPELEGTISNRWLTTLTIDQQALGVTPMDIINALAEENIEARPVWKPLHLQPVFDGVPASGRLERFE